MKRHIIFEKNARVANALMATGKCKNEGNWIFSCDDNMEDMKILQQAVSEVFKGTDYRNFLLGFANEDDYSDLVTFN